MKLRVIGAALLVAALGVVAATASASSGRQQANKLTVWLQVDAQSGWPDLVAAANQQFQSDHPGWTVDVQYQNWGDHLQKFDATIAGEHVARRDRDGQHGDDEVHGGRRVRRHQRRSSRLVRQLGELARRASPSRATYGGKTLRRPYYAGSRVVTYRTDLYKKAGIKTAPTSLAQFTADAKKLAGHEREASRASRPSTSPAPTGTSRWLRLRLRRHHRHDARRQVGRHARLDEVHRGPDRVQELLAGRVEGEQDDATRTTRRRTTSTRRAGAGSIIGPGWFSCCVGNKYKGATAQFVMPSHTTGQPMPGFLGGSDLAIPADERRTRRSRPTGSRTSPARATRRRLQAKGNIPNATNLLGTSVNERAAARSWFVPAAKHWVDVENGNILRNMLSEILHREADREAGRAVRERQHHLGPERELGRTERDPDSSNAPPTTPPPPRPRWSRRRAASRWRRVGRATVPYLLILPVIVAIGGDPRLPDLQPRPPVVPAATGSSS